MTIFVTLSIIQAISISLGVGSSTLAILNFFKAIADGKIDEAERKMMGVTYTVLRVAMILILVSTIGILGLDYYLDGILSMTGYDLAIITLISMLFINASLMTAKMMPSKFGPAIQASTWYSLGFILALVPHGLDDFGYIPFLAYYLGFIIMMILVVNQAMSFIMARNKPAAN